METPPSGMSPLYCIIYAEVNKDVKVCQGEKFMVSEDEIRKMRGE